MNGHFSGEYHQISKNDAGEDVIEMVADYQSRSNGGDGWMRLIEVDTDQGRLSFSTYSPVLNSFETDSNSLFSIPIDFQRRFGLPDLPALSTYTFQDGRVVEGTIYNSTKDTQIRKNNPTTNYGTSSTPLLVDDADVGAQNRSQTLLAFENIIGVGPAKIPAGSQIVSAQLIVDSVNPGNGASLHRMLRPWSESDTWNTLANGVTPNNQEARSESLASFGSAQLFALPTQRNLSIDVTEDIQAWVNGQANYGWALLPWETGTDGWSFSPSEAAALDARPKLVITWLTPAATNSPTLTADQSSSFVYVEDGQPIHLFGGAFVEVVSPSQSRLEVLIGDASDPLDRLAINRDQLQQFGFTISGQLIMRNQQPLATFAGGIGSVPLRIDFSNAADQASIQMVLRSIVYRNSSDTPNTTRKLIEARIYDGQYASSNKLISSVRIQPTNDPPEVYPSRSMVQYAAGQNRISIDPQIRVIDPDATPSAAGTIEIELAAEHPTDRIVIAANGSAFIGLLIDGSTIYYDGVAIADLDPETNQQYVRVSLRDNVTSVAREAILQSVAFETQDPRLQPNERSIQIRVSDNSGGISTPVVIGIQQSLVRHNAFQNGLPNGEVNYDGTIDIQISQNAPSTSYPIGSGNDGLMVDFDSAGANTQVLLRFDNIFGSQPHQVPLGSRIVSAKLVVYTGNPGDGASLHRMNQSWSSSATWNSFANNGPWNTIGGVQTDDLEAKASYTSQIGVASGNGDADAGFTNIGVTRDVQAWANGEANFGWVLSGWNAMTNGWAFFASENADPLKRPLLEISWIDSSIAMTTFQNGVNNYDGTVDTQLRQDAPGTTYSTTTTLFSDYNSTDPSNNLLTLSDQSQVLMKFENIAGSLTTQVPTGSLVHRAILTIASNTSNAPGDGGRFHSMLQPWNDSSTWNSMINGISADGVEASQNTIATAGDSSLSTKASGGWNDFDVTSDVRRWVRGDNANHGWAILPWITGQDGWGIQSSESANLDERPKLTIFYTAPEIEVSTSQSNLVVNELGATQAIFIKLATPPTSDVTITVHPRVSGEVSLSTSQFVFTPNNWELPQVLFVQGIDDQRRDGDQTVELIFDSAISSDVAYSGRAIPRLAVLNIDNGVLPPTVQSVRINDNSAQRSNIRSLQITFDSIVTAPAQSFVLERFMAGSFLPISSSDLTINQFDISLSNQTRALITFSGPTIVGGSLPDGEYRLRILADQIHANGLKLDGDQDGLAGGDFVFGSQDNDRFFRLFGDTNGDRSVNIFDLNEFRLAYGTGRSDLDYDLNGIINIFDLNEFRRRYGSRLS